jgi:hypothetical protein
MKAVELNILLVLDTSRYGNTTELFNTKNYLRHGISDIDRLHTFFSIAGSMPLLF